VHRLKFCIFAKIRYNEALITQKLNKAKWFKAGGAILFALSLLLQSGAGAVTTMVCAGTGSQSVKVGAKADLCCDHGTPDRPVVQIDCCSSQTNDFVFTAFRNFSDDLVQDFTAQFQKVEIPFISAPKRVKLSKANLINAPPIPGRALLIRICKYSL
jgi:hypothetical protein